MASPACDRVKLGRSFHIRVISVYHYDLLFHREPCNVAQVILADHHGVGDIHGAVAVYIGGFFLRICRGNIAQIDLADQHGIGDINDAICIQFPIMLFLR